MPRIQIIARRTSRSFVTPMLLYTGLYLEFVPDISYFHESLRHTFLTKFVFRAALVYLMGIYIVGMSEAEHPGVTKDFMEIGNFGAYTVRALY